MSDKDKDLDTPKEATAEAIEDAEVIEEVSAEVTEDATETAAEEIGNQVEEVTEEEAPEEPEVLVDPSDMQMPPEQRSPLVPMILGGVVAGAIGFGAATVLQLDLFGSDQPTAYAQETRGMADEQGGQISALQADLKRVEGLADQSALRDELGAISAAIDTNFSEDVARLSAQITALQEISAQLSDRLGAVESRPIQEMVSDASVEAYEAEMTKLREAIASHRADIEAMAADARAAEAAARAETLKSKGAALVTDLSLAVSGGAPYAAHIAQLEAEGATIPAALKAQAAEGVPTQTQLSEAFPDAARAALRAIRQDETGEGGQGGVMAFLQDQLGVRSVAPKEGDSADAILSRAEAALKAGDVAASLAEVASLPESGQQAMTNWVGSAEIRADALAALWQLKQELSGQ